MMEGHPRILIFRIGQLGDTIAALPAMWAVRNCFPRAYIAFLGDRHANSNFVVPEDLLPGIGLIDEFIYYCVKGGFGRIMQAFRLLFMLRARSFDRLIYLAPSDRTGAQVRRDRCFFIAAGIVQLSGMIGFPEPIAKEQPEPMQPSPSETDLLLARLARDGIPEFSDRQACFDLKLGVAEDREVDCWLRTLPLDGGRPWIGVGLGSKIQSNRWPQGRYVQVVAHLIRAFDIWPVVFGGPEDRQCASEFLSECQRGFTTIDSLSLRSSAAALKRCVLYLGNNCGTMHLAAAMGVPCVAIHSSRDLAGRWYPYGQGHRVFRTAIECEACALVECVERKNECINRIQTAEVIAACQEILEPRPEVRGTRERLPAQAEPGVPCP